MGQIFVKASRRAKAYVRSGGGRSGFKTINNSFKRQAKIHGGAPISQRESGQLQIKRYKLANQMPKMTVQHKRLNVRRMLHVKSMYNGK